MAKAGQVTNYFTFIGGKNTESSALASPPNTALEIVNFDLRRDGSLWRRKGLAEETGGSASATLWGDDDLADKAIKTYTWTNVGGRGAYSFIVIQIGTDLRFYSNESTVTSDNLKGTVSLEDYAVDGGKAPRTRFDFASGKGRLYVVGEYTQPVYIEYDSLLSTFSVEPFDLLMRDFDGIDDNIGDQERPSVLTSEHHYNLLNSGWPDRKMLCTALFGLAIGKAFPTQWFKTWSTIKKWPAKADLYYSFKDDNSPNPYGVGSFSPNVADTTFGGNTSSPKGHFILNAFTRDRQGPFGNYTKNAGITEFDKLLNRVYSHSSGEKATYAKNLSVPQDPIFRRPSCVGFFAGRAFFSGVFGDEFNNRVYYSQIITDPINAAKCYQENDPTVEDFNKLLDTDGGVLTIAEAGSIYAIHPVGDYLIVFANNGIWAIGGTDGGQFKPTAVSVKKISSAGALGRDCCGQASNIAMYMSAEGLFVITLDQTSGYPVAQNASLSTIQTDYLAINEAARANSTLLIDRNEMIAYWFYDDSASFDNISYPSLWNKALVYNMPLQAFYDYNLAVDRDDVLTVVPTMPFITAGSSLVSITEGVWIDAEYQLAPDATITVGASGRDYTTLQAARNAIFAGTHGAGPTFAVLVDAGTYTGGLTAIGSTKNIIWKSRDGAATTILSGSGGNVWNFSIKDNTSPPTVVVEGFTFNQGVDTGASMIQTESSASDGTLVFSKCIFNTIKTILVVDGVGGYAGNTANILFRNTQCNVTSPLSYQINSNSGVAYNVALNLDNTDFNITGTPSGDGFTTVTTTGASDITAVATDGNNVFLVSTNDVIVGASAREYVYDGGGAVTVSLDSYVTNPIKIQVPSFLGSNAKYLHFYDFSDTSFQDYGVSNTAHILTGYEMLGDAIRDKSANYVFSFFNRTETDYTTNQSGCTLRIKWEWTNLNTSGRWTDQETIYRLNPRVVSTSPAPFFYPYDVVSTKTRFRGQGKAVNFLFESVDDKDCQLLGWSVPWTGETAP